MTKIRRCTRGNAGRPFSSLGRLRQRRSSSSVVASSSTTPGTAAAAARRRANRRWGGRTLFSSSSIAGAVLALVVAVSSRWGQSRSWSSSPHRPSSSSSSDARLPLPPPLSSSARMDPRRRTARREGGEHRSDEERIRRPKLPISFLAAMTRGAAFALALVVLACVPTPAGGVSFLLRGEEDESTSHVDRRGKTSSGGGGGRGGGIRWHRLSVSYYRRRRWFFGGRGGGRGDRRTDDDGDGGDGVDDDANGDGDGRTYLLESSSFYIPNGKVCGIIGPSGSGKSTLLAALGGTTLKGGGIEVGGSVWIERGEAVSVSEDDDGAKTNHSAAAAEKSFLSSSDGDIAMLHQHDNFFSMLTPRETLELAAHLQLGDVLPNHRSRLALVDKTLDSLGLSGGSADRRVGDRALGSHGHGGGLWGGSGGGGLSGGERRRLSLGLEIIASPRVFLADEPTTGLDSSQAEKVVGLMVDLARERDVPCIFSLHQPRASIWRALDSFVLLAPGGKVCYMGPRKDAASYFAEHFGWKVPPETNPAEFFIDLVSIDTEDPEKAAEDLERIDRMASVFAAEVRTRVAADSADAWKPPNGNGSSALGRDRRKSRRHTNFLERLSVLFLRAWRQNARNMRVNFLRLATSVGEGILFAELFASVKPGRSIAKSVADRTALLSFGVINMVMMAVMKTLHLFGTEKVVVTRERMRRQYSSLEYLLSKALAEIPIDASFAAAFAYVLKSRTSLRIPLNVLTWTFSLMAAAGASLGFALGSVAPNVESAMALGVPVTVVLMAVGIINPSGVDVSDVAKTPAVIRWMKMASPIKWAIEALVVAEFRGMEFDDGGRRAGVRWRDLPRMGGLALVQNGDQVLDSLGLADMSYHSLMKGLAILTGVNLFVSWLGLAFGGPDFLEAEDGLLDDYYQAAEGGLDGKDRSKSQQSATSSPGEANRKLPTVRKL